LLVVGLAVGCLNVECLALGREGRQGHARRNGGRQ